MASPADQRLLDILRRRGVATARELGLELGISQPGVSRALAAAGARVVRIGRARRTRYATTRDVRGMGSSWPLYRIDARGQAHAFGHLTTLHGDACLLDATPAPAWLRGEFAEGLFPGLPWFLDDLRPQGFLGSQFAHRWARELDLPDDLQRWNGDAVLTALLLHGEAGAGDFVLGEASLQRALRAQPDMIAASSREARYAELAEATLAGERVGSSAAGEQPKFSTCVRDGDNTLRHVIVKFSEPVQDSTSAQRWADLLIAEHAAARTLAEHGVASARTELIQSHGRCCLEATRFDRVGAHGRRGLVTLAAWSDAYGGARDDWPSAAARMTASGWLSVKARDEVCLRWWFGQLIGNSDMHFGNLAFFLGDTLPLELAPTYDMLPMSYRPSSTGALVARPFDPPPPMPEVMPYWSEAAACAMGYWQRVAEDAEISADFRKIAERNGDAVQRLRRRFG